MRVECVCTQCNIEFTKHKSQVRSKNNFCSRSCAATYTNKAVVKRKPKERRCSNCTLVLTKEEHRRKYCNICKGIMHNNIKDRTLGEERAKLKTLGRHRTSLHVNVRMLNRIWNRDLIKKPCFSCGYDKHVELAHIKPVAKFPDTATLAEVNARSNVVQLCPNCHWEFDNNLLDFKSVA